MAVSFRSSSSSGDGTFSASKGTLVPSGSAALDVALVGLYRWEVANPVVTKPSGFAELVEVVFGSTKLNVYWKRLAGAESGSWTFSWSGNQWAVVMAVLIPGALTVGDPVAVYDTATGTGTNVPDLSLSTVVEPFLVHFTALDSTGTGTPPTNFTELHDVNELKMNYRIPAAVGTQLAVGATVSPGQDTIAALVAVAPTATAPVVDVGEDSWAVVDGAFGRLAVEHDMGSAIVARAWTVEAGPEEVGNVVGTDVTCTWSPTTIGSYVLRYTATNGIGSGYDEVNLEVGAPVEGPQNSSRLG